MKKPGTIAGFEKIAEKIQPIGEFRKCRENRYTIRLKDRRPEFGATGRDSRHVAKAASRQRKQRGRSCGRDRRGERMRKMARSRERVVVLFRCHPNDSRTERFPKPFHAQLRFGFLFDRVRCHHCDSILEQVRAGMLDSTGLRARDRMRWQVIASLAECIADRSEQSRFRASRVGEDRPRPAMRRGQSNRLSDPISSQTTTRS